MKFNWEATGIYQLGATPTAAGHFARPSLLVFISENRSDSHTHHTHRFPGRATFRRIVHDPEPNVLQPENLTVPRHLFPRTARRVNPPISTTVSRDDQRSDLQQYVRIFITRSSKEEEATLGEAAYGSAYVLYIPKAGVTSPYSYVVRQVHKQ